MKRILDHMILAAVILLAAACTKDRSSGPVPDEGLPIAITVADAGYASADGIAPASSGAPSSLSRSSDAPFTRTIDEGYVTAFEPGDACGLYIVSNGKVVMTNIRLTATEGAGEGSLVWMCDEELSYRESDSYYIYFPYLETAPEGAPLLSEDAPDADGSVFFADMIDAWKPAGDQSLRADYTASDLMTARAEISETEESAVISFRMVHNMALAVVSLPAEETVTFIGDAVPYESDGVYRYIARPESGAALKGYWPGEEGRLQMFDIGVSLAGGTYRIYEVGEPGE